MSFNTNDKFNTLSGTLIQATTISASVLSASSLVGAALTASNITNFTNDVRAQFTQGTNITIAGGVISSTGGGGTPGGAETQIQFNSGSTFSGSSKLIYDYTNNILSGTVNQFTILTGSKQSIYTTNDMGSFTAGGIVSAGTTKTGSIAANASDTYGIYFHPSGTYMYAVDIIQDKVIEYSLSTPWDISTLSYTAVTASIAAEEITVHDIFFHPDGTYFYIIGGTGDDINQYSMSPAWSLGSATFFGSSSANGYEFSPTGMFFKTDGTSVFIVGTSGVVRQHSLTTPWDVTTMVTSSLLSSINIASIVANISGITFSNDGKKMYIIASTAGTRCLHEFALTTAWDVSTGTSFTVHNIGNVQNTMTSTSVIMALFLRPDGTNMYFMNLATDKVIQYNMNKASLSIGNGVVQINDGLAVYGNSAFTDIGARTLTTTSTAVVGTNLEVGSTISCGSSINATGPISGSALSSSSTIRAGGAITGSGGLSISGGTTTIGGGAGQNLNVTTAGVFSGPTVTFGSNTIVTGSVAKFDTVIGKYATYSANFTASAISYFNGINSASGVITASLSGSTSYTAGQTLIFKDISGNASVNNIRIQPSGSDTIDGSVAGTVITTNSGSIRLVCNGVNGFYIV